MEMSERPKLNREMSSEIFQDYYYLKEELVDFCRENGLPVSGNKMEITKRIVNFLDTGKIEQLTVRSINRNVVGEINENTVIEPDIVCSQKHRAFFRNRIGRNFSFNVQFQKWLKSNTGRTYGDAISAYYRIMEEKKKEKNKIDKQFEYNTYIRDFFCDNQGKSLEEAIICWKYKKSLPGHNRYEQSDLVALTLMEGDICYATDE